MGHKTTINQDVIICNKCIFTTSGLKIDIHALSRTSTMITLLKAQCKSNFPQAQNEYTYGQLQYEQGRPV